MSEIQYPADVIRELASLRNQAEKGVEVLAEVETKYVMLSLDAEKVEALAFMNAMGTVADRTAIAKIESLDARQAAELAKVELNRVKTKLKHLTDAQMAVQTSGRMVELQWRTAGVGER